MDLEYKNKNHQKSMWTTLCKPKSYSLNSSELLRFRCLEVGAGEFDPMFWFYGSPCEALPLHPDSIEVSPGHCPRNSPRPTHSQGQFKVYRIETPSPNKLLVMSNLEPLWNQGPGSTPNISHNIIIWWLAVVLVDLRADLDSIEGDVRYKNGSNLPWASNSLVNFMC